MENSLENYNPIDAQKRIEESLLPDCEKKTLLDFVKDIHIDGVRRQPMLEVIEGRKGVGKPFQLKFSPTAMSISELFAGKEMTEGQYDFVLAHEMAGLVGAINENDWSDNYLNEIKALYLSYYDKCSRLMRIKFMLDDALDIAK